MSSDLPVGVIGVGNMGRHHARVFAELPGARLVGVADADDETAHAVASEYGARPREIDALLDDAAAVSIAVPTRHHARIAVRALDQGVGALVEKPLAASIDEAEALVEAAEATGEVLQVGHVERFNPAVEAATALLEEADPIALDAQRLGPPRDGGDHVALDLMIHDLDVICALVGSEFEVVGGAGPETGQYAAALLRGGAGETATLAASRTTQRNVRRLSVTTADRHLEVDYLDQSVCVYRSTVPEYVEAADGLRHRRRTVVERPTVDGEEPLKRELRSFLAAVRGEHPPRVTGRDGLRALRLAASVKGATAEHAEVASR